MTRASGLAASILATLVVACGSHLPQPASTPHPANAFVEVPYPPPPGRVEMVPPSPRGGAVWIDGQWQWEGSRWVWEAGGWVEPPAGARFSRWAVRRAADGRLYFAGGTWRDARGIEIAPPPPIVIPEKGGGVPSVAGPP